MNQTEKNTKKDIKKGEAAKRKRSKKETKLLKVLKIIGYVLCGIMFVSGCIMTAFAAKLKMVPIKYMLIAAVLFVIITVGFVAAQRNLTAGLITKVLAVLITCVCVIGCTYIHYTYRKLNEMTGITTKIDNIQVYVLNEDPAQNVLDAKDYPFGILKTLDRDNTNSVIAEIQTEVAQPLFVSEYETAIALVKGLYDREVQAIILNSAYEGFITETEGYEDFKSRVRSISFKDIVTEMESDNMDREAVKEDVFTIYVSGVDVGGKPENNSNSDVNILLTVNKNTRQILMINTPRDYYVPLSISNGVCDKLTHAGIYGIDVSADTLGLLYDVTVDGYVKVNFTGFEKIIDVLDGVNVYSDYAFSAHGYSFQQGYNQLDGRGALIFARQRKMFSDGDRQRGKNQMAVIKAVIEDIASSDMLRNYKNVLDEISDSMVTSVSYEEISDLAQFQLDDMKPWDVQTYSVNGYDSMNVTYSGGSEKLYVMVPNEETVDQAKQYLKDIYDNKVIHVPTE
ncbi:MAG: LCP family protein [Eubacteriales bacterium]|nr:LCP family protein [Eubacteriales bacterium]